MKEIDLKQTPLFSIYERTILANQYRILEKLYPENIDYRIAREAVENGYESYYFENNIHMECNILSEDQTNEIIDILNMFRNLNMAFLSLPDKEDLTLEEVSFRGWSYNDEANIRAFTDWFCNKQIEKNFIEFDVNKNSIGEMLPTYRKIHCKYKKITKSSNYNLNINTIKEIVR